MDQERRDLRVELLKCELNELNDLLILSIVLIVAGVVALGYGIRMQSMMTTMGSTVVIVILVGGLRWILKNKQRVKAGIQSVTSN